MLGDRVFVAVFVTLFVADGVLVVVLDGVIVLVRDLEGVLVLEPVRDGVRGTDPVCDAVAACGDADAGNDALIDPVEGGVALLLPVGVTGALELGVALDVALLLGVALLLLVELETGVPVATGVCVLVRVSDRVGEWLRVPEAVNELELEPEPEALDDAEVVAEGVVDALGAILAEAVIEPLGVRGGVPLGVPVLELVRLVVALLELLALPVREEDIDAEPDGVVLGVPGGEAVREPVPLAVPLFVAVCVGELLGVTLPLGVLLGVILPLGELEGVPVDDGTGTTDGGAFQAAFTGAMATPRKYVPDGAVASVDNCLLTVPYRMSALGVVAYRKNSPTSILPAMEYTEALVAPVRACRAAMLQFPVPLEGRLYSSTLHDDGLLVSVTNRELMEANTKVHGDRPLPVKPGNLTAGVAACVVGCPVPMANTDAQPESVAESEPYS